jgi:hypothetical protein
LKFATIQPRYKKIDVVDVPELVDAERAVGLKPGEVDFGTINGRLSIVVYEYSLLAKPSEQSYFAIRGALYAGNAVIFGTDDEGSTVDVGPLPPVTFFEDAEAVSRAIALGRVERPRVAVNDATLWAWGKDQ